MVNTSGKLKAYAQTVDTRSAPPLIITPGCEASIPLANTLLKLAYHIPAD